MFLSPQRAQRWVPMPRGGRERCRISYPSIVEVNRSGKVADHRDYIDNVQPGAFSITGRTAP